MRLSTEVRRWMMILSLVGGIWGVWGGPAASAQGPDEETIEALAMQVHLQNLRTFNYTAWIGGNLGDEENAPWYTAAGEQLQDWTLPGQAGDADFTLESLRRPTLLNFWASWCLPCVLEFPHLAEVALAPEDHTFDVVFVNVSDLESDALAYLADYDPALYTVVDWDDKLSVQAEIDAIPTSLLLNVDGTVLVVHSGMVTPTVSAFLDAVAAQPGIGSFDAASAPLDPPPATLQPVDVDSAAPLQDGWLVRGALTNDDFQHAYRFEGHAGDVVSITLQAEQSDLDTYLVLMTVDGERLAENDDAGFSTDSAIESITLPADGTYMVVVTRFLEDEGFSTGTYCLEVTGFGPETASGAPQDDRIISYGAVVTDSVAGNAPQAFYSFAGQAGDVITVRVSHDPGGVPLRVEIKDPHIARLVVSEEAVNGEVALENIELPEDGNYLIVVFRSMSRDTLPQIFTLTLEPVDVAEVVVPDEEAAPPAGGGGTVLAYGDTVTGMITDAHSEDQWTFEGQAGDVITVIMARTVDEMGGLDGYLILLGPDGTTLLEADDSSDSVMPIIDDFELPADGVYTLVASRFGFQNGFSIGEYTLSLSKEDGIELPPDGNGDEMPVGAACARWLDPHDPPTDLRRITYNDPVVGMITGDDYEDWFVFRGRAGDSITILMMAAADDLDPYLMLLDAEGCALDSNDDASRSATESTLVAELPEDGTYFIRATRYGFAHGPSSGDYTLVIQTGAAPASSAEDADPPDALDLGTAATGTLSLDNLGDQYTFTGSAGMMITASVHRSGGDLDPALVLRGPDGQQIALNRDWLSPDEARIARFTLPEDGLYTLDVILEDLNTAGEYELLLLAEARGEIPDSSVRATPGTELDIVLLWDAPAWADLDLTVRGPAGERDGEILDRANDFCADLVLAPATPTERVVWETGTAAAGLYAIEVWFQFDCAGAGQPVDFTLVLLHGSTVVDVITGTLAREGDGYSTTLDYRP